MNTYETLMCASYLSNAVILFVLGIFVFCVRPNGAVNAMYAFYSLCIAWWSIFSIPMITATSPEQALIWDRLCLLGVVFIPSAFFGFTCSFLQLSPRHIFFSKLFYLASFFFAVLDFTPYFVIETRPVYLLRNFTNPGIGYYLFFGYCLTVVVWSVLLIYFRYRSETDPLRKQQVTYLFWSTVMGYVGGSLNFNLVFNIRPFEIIPYANFLTGLYGLAVAYAIVKYRLMDIRVAVASTGIFLAVYAVALGIPFYLYRSGQHFAALIVAVLLATAAPFIYARLKREAEERILKDQQTYHDVLIRSAQELTRIKDVQGIAQSVIDSLVKAGSPSGVALYIKEDARFMRKAFMGKLEQYPAVLAGAFETRPSNWDEHVLLPLSRAGEVIGYVVLGNKADNDLWTERDLNSVRALIDQAALAIENAVYVENLQRTQEQLVESEKMATIGFLVGGLAHQLKNRLTPLVFNSEFAARKIDAHREAHLPASACDETIGYLQRISDGVESSKEVINGILNYASDRETKTDVDLKKLVAASIELIQFKIKPDTVVFENNIDHSIPPVKGNFAQLQEVFFNIIDNAHHSMMEKKAANGDPSYQPKITFEAKPSDDGVTLTITDNGMGVKEEHMRKLFTPLFSTKAKTKQGHGLGLYVMKQIIEKNHAGRIHFWSEYGHGVRIEIHLPL